MPKKKKQAAASGGTAKKHVDLYEMLNVARDATPAQIRKAYHALARRVHPDKCRDDPNAVANFQALGRAYAILKDEQKRARYDATGCDDGESEAFWDAYERYRGVKVTADDIDAYVRDYKGSAAEERDLEAYYAQHGGDVTRILEAIVGCTDGDIPRFLEVLERIAQQHVRDAEGKGEGKGKGKGKTKGKGKKGKDDAVQAMRRFEATRGAILTESQLEAEEEYIEIGCSEDEDEDEDDAAAEFEDDDDDDDFIVPDDEVEAEAEVPQMQEMEEAQEEQEQEQEQEQERANGSGKGKSKRARKQAAPRRKGGGGGGKSGSGSAGGDIPESLLAMFAAKDKARSGAFDAFEQRWAGSGAAKSGAKRRKQ